MFFLAAFLISYFTTIKSIDILIKFGYKFKLFDYPNSRKKHSSPKVRIGGLSILIGTFFFTIVYFLNPSFAEYTFSNLLKISIIFSFLSYLLGLLDDIFTISPILRLFFQIVIASLAFANGLNINLGFLDNIFNSYFLNFLEYIITCFWLVGGINAINWLDGLDGLASGISSILFLTISLISFAFGFSNLGIFAAANAVAAISFTQKNFHPSKILMGDGGSYFLGFQLSSMTIVLANSLNIDQTFSSEILKYYSSLVLIIFPYFDLVRVVILRILKGKSPFLPDRIHLHYKMLDKGIKHEYVVIAMYGICIITILPTIIIILNQAM